MDNNQFQRLKEKFQAATVDEKIDLYVTTEGLTQNQYKELLRVFPLDQISKLEEAL
ncbi:MAG: hypothetical protein GX962_00490 [Epulopiscium sp.]|nr:hypothetical protein [Candidatus Epulonipiscium sp.]